MLFPSLLVQLWVERGRSLAREGAWGAALESCWSHALVFTPQYGDLFVEMLRAALWRRLASRFGRSARRGSASEAALREELRAWRTEVSSLWNFAARSNTPFSGKRAVPIAPPISHHFKAVEQLCVLAGPNHGLLWDRLLARLGGERACVPLQVLARAKLDMLAALLAASPDELLHDVLFGESSE
jgi:hypothetical protein